MGQHPISLVGSMLLVAPTRPGAQTLAAYAALEYTQVRGVKVVGELGNQYATVPRNHIGLVRPYQAMTGALAELSLQIELIRIADAGQDILRAAVGITPGYSYCARRPDGSELYFSGEMNTLMNGAFEAKSIAEQRCTMAVTSKVFETT